MIPIRSVAVFDEIISRVSNFKKHLNIFFYLDNHKMNLDKDSHIVTKFYFQDINDKDNSLQNYSFSILDLASTR